MAIGHISIHSVNAKLDIQSTRAELDMKQQQAQVQIDTKLPRVIIDQTECFNTSGLKNNTALIDTAANEAKQNALQYIETTVGDGHTFAAIENPGTTGEIVAQIATRNMFQEHEFGLVSMPSARPRIEVTGSINIDFLPRDLGTLNGVTNYVNLGKIYTQYTPANVTINYSA